MTETPPREWIYIGQCPECGDGLCRVRTCLQAGVAHFYALCDECEAMWLAPSISSPHAFPDATRPECPICHQDLYGPQAHWSVAEELRGSEWLTNAIVDVPDPGRQGWQALAGRDDDASYGQDDPKPGC